MPKLVYQLADSEVTVKRDILAGLIAHSLNTHAGNDAPCCSNCCAPCASVMQLAADSTIDAVLVEMGPGYDWWDDSTASVSRPWLAAHISPSCNAMSGIEVENCLTPDAQTVTFTH